MKILGYIALAVVVLVGGFYALNNYIYTEKQGNLADDYKDVTFTISGEPITLINGIHQVPSAEGAASIVTTQYFGNEAMADIDGDGDEDVVFLVSQDGAGTGTFFFLVGAIKEDLGYRGTEAVYIGDRIALQTTEFRDGLIVVNYVDRAPGEPFSAIPSVGKSLYLKYDSQSQSFGEVVQDFEGEHNLTITTFEECAAAGFPIAESYPRQCRVPGEEPFIENIGNELEKMNLIRLDSPRPNQTISSPAIVTGEARGYWFFEADFPIFVVDWNGQIIGQGYASAEGEWMTEEFVPFRGTVTFDTSQIQNQYSNRGALILQKSNASGLPEHDDALEIPVVLE